MKNEREENTTFLLELREKDRNRPILEILVPDWLISDNQSRDLNKDL